MLYLIPVAGEERLWAEWAGINLEELTQEIQQIVAANETFSIPFLDLKSIYESEVGTDSYESDKLLYICRLRNGERAKRKLHRLEKDLSDCLRAVPKSVVRIKMRYSGSGDYGAFEAPEYTDANGDIVQVDDPYDAIEEYLSCWLENEHCGWEDDGGAHGMFEIDLATRQVTNDHCAIYSSEDTSSDTFTY